uniref:ATP phosphoribosyltransferase n=1 Tax=Bicosoecida sp. CB-2014 TaxID=1486930 RepID=A0A7S1CHR3_9STRA|mmetsp:Transcript_25163/g.87797  ORF Transcript_25163/g.87797 Transcript_25163/m.87797 type:complete len:310 (+) Transcript_25163:126-1055(+)|eukprot:CAMPEP_0203816728 /NCGR_PEP_ID=MMETSP0115-20131106/18045_1 /ASSEMBLY_ACC=CAM_ASM_000227 /TAXON_ID=33651 /ORGANISM="Bicosoecid sp, Strain ms1" /LENGTH=309 /DNA_ID=CAMNT_0050725637 /DNA_START=126 /DNA_END=1055 /DNA_ORIENTATION=+
MSGDGAAGGAGGGDDVDGPVIRLALPKGRMKDKVFDLLKESGISVELSNDRTYRPKFGLPGYDVKLLKPQNILGMLHTGTRDVGFGGLDWAQELGLADEIVEVLDTGMDPVRVVAAAPRADILEKGSAATPGNRRVIVASEYQNLTKEWIAKRGMDAEFFRAYGATEALPPDDVDLIVDNTATGSTLEANKLTIVDVVMHSTTRLFASRAAWEVPEKKARIQELALLLKSVLEARKRVMVTFNVMDGRLPALLAELGSDRLPTVSHLKDDAGFAVQLLCLRKESAVLIPKIIAGGGSSVVVTEVRQFIE